MKRVLLTSALCLAAAITALGLATCGLVTAPVSVPAAVAQNANYALQGTVVDTRGNPLDGVIVNAASEHHIWTPIAGSHDNASTFTRRVDKTYSFDARGTYFELGFSKDGYTSAHYRLEHDRPGEVISSLGTWPNIKNFPVVLVDTRPRDANLLRWAGTIDYSDYPTASRLGLTYWAEPPVNYPLLSRRSVEEANAFRPGELYLTLTREAPAPKDAKGTIDPDEINLPGQVTLHIVGPNAGFVRIEPNIGYHPLLTSDTAPTTGYTPDFTISRARLKQMRSAKPDRIIEAYEYFYLRANNRFGKLVFSFADPGPVPTASARSPRPTVFRYQLYLNPLETDHDLTTHNLK